MTLPSSDSDAQTKTEHPNEDAITDEVTAKIYIEQFGLEVFNRADTAIRNNKASRFGGASHDGGFN